MQRDLLELGTGQLASAVGRVVLLHAGADDCTGAAGNAGTMMMAQGVIGIAPPASFTHLAVQTEQTGSFTGVAVMRPTASGASRVALFSSAWPMRPT